MLAKNIVILVILILSLISAEGTTEIDIEIKESILRTNNIIKNLLLLLSSESNAITVSEAATSTQSSTTTTTTTTTTPKVVTTTPKQNPKKYYETCSQYCTYGGQACGSFDQPVYCLICRYQLHVCKKKGGFL